MLLSDCLVLLQVLPRERNGNYSSAERANAFGGSNAFVSAKEGTADRKAMRKVGAGGLFVCLFVSLIVLIFPSLFLLYLVHSGKAEE